MNIFTSGLKRNDLSRVYYYAECDKTLAYAKEKMDVKGVSDYYERMKTEKNHYTVDINNIVNPEKENEEKKYLRWEHFTRIRQISAWICLASSIIWLIYIFNASSEVIFIVLSLVWSISFLTFIVGKIGAFL